MQPEQQERADYQQVDADDPIDASRRPVISGTGSFAAHRRTSPHSTKSPPQEREEVPAVAGGTGRISSDTQLEVHVQPVRRRTECE